MIKYRYTLPEGYYAGEIEEYEYRAANARPEKPEILNGFWPRWPVEDPAAKAWGQIEDHRERKPPYYPEECAQDATEFWLPIDAWDSPARKMVDIGPLPEDALLVRPEKPLEVAQEQKRREIDAGYEAALVAALTMPSASPTPMTVAVETSALLAVDPDAVDSIKAALSARRTELMGKVGAAKTPIAVEAITVSYPV